MNIFAKRGIGKRGQVTLFIIAGVVILFAAFLVGYLQNESFRQRVESQLFGAAVVPEQAKGVVSYTNNCIEKIARDGIDLLGLQGGYIEIPRGLSSRQYLQADPIMKVPYWIYGSKREIPTLQEMELQLENYVNERANIECDFFEFQEYEFSNDEIFVDVKILNDGVLVDLDSELIVGIKESKYFLRDYVGVSVPIDLMFLYDRAIDIVNREARSGNIGNAPLEFATIELIARHSKDEDSEISIPPLYKFDNKCNPKNWLMTDVADNVKEILSDNLRFLRVEGADNLDYGNDYINLVIDRVFTRNYDVRIDFNYNQEWPLFLDIYPRNGAVLKPNTLKIGLPFLPLLCFTTYDFKYTIRYPLMVNLEKDNYIFRFPLEVFVSDNYAWRNIEGEKPDIVTDTGTRFCREEWRSSNEFSVVTVDAVTMQPLDDVNVIYTCGGVDNCEIGNTKFENGEAILNEKFPLCYNGEIRLSKEGYGEVGIELTTLDNPGERKLGVMKPFTEKEIELKILELDNGIVNERSLAENEMASVQFNILEGDVIKDTVGIVFGDDEVEDKGINKISLLPEQEYNILISLVLDEKIVIPMSKYQGVEIPEQEIDDVLLGGADFEDYIYDKDLKDSSKVIVYALSEGVPKNYEEYIERLDVKAMSDLHKEKLLLRFE